MRGFLASLVDWGASGLLCAAILDGAGLPIPGGVDALIIFLGARRPDEVWWLAFVAVLGSFCGNFLLYLLARRGGQMYLERRVQSKRAQKLRGWFQHYGLLTVFIAALVPLPIMPLKIFVLSAGAMGSKPWAFALSFIAARVPRYLALVFLGRTMGDNALGYLRTHVWHLCAFAAVLFLALFVVVKVFDYRRARMAPLQ